LSKTNQPQTVTVLHTVLKFQFQFHHICSQGEKVNTNFVGKLQQERRKENTDEASLVITEHLCLQHRCKYRAMLCCYVVSANRYSVCIYSPAALRHYSAD